MHSQLRTCVNGPLFEQACVLVQLPTMASCMLPGYREHRLVLEQTKRNSKFGRLWLHNQHRQNRNGEKLCSSKPQHDFHVTKKYHLHSWAAEATEHIKQAFVLFYVRTTVYLFFGACPNRIWYLWEFDELIPKSLMTIYTHKHEKCHLLAKVLQE